MASADNCGAVANGNSVAWQFTTPSSNQLPNSAMACFSHRVPNGFAQIWHWQNSISQNSGGQVTAGACPRHTATMHSGARERVIFCGVVLFSLSALKFLHEWLAGMDGWMASSLSSLRVPPAACHASTQSELLLSSLWVRILL